MVVFLEKVFPPYFSGFFGKSQKKFKVGKVGKYDDKTEYFEKKNAFIFLKDIVAARLRSLRTDDPLRKGHSRSIKKELEL